MTLSIYLAKVNSFHPPLESFEKKGLDLLSGENSLTIELMLL